MLHSKQICQVLSQGLSETPVPTRSQDTSRLVGAILISLLSNKGIPLSTVYNKLELLTVDNIKIYLLLVYNYYRSLKPGDNWAAMELDKDLSIMIAPVGGQGRAPTSSAEDGASDGAGGGASGGEIDINGNHPTTSTPQDDEFMYVVILYDKTLPNAVAKLKLDNLVEALNKGFAGYNS